MADLPVPSGCSWPIDEGCLTGWDGLDPAVQQRSIEFASATLRRLTGYRVGGCPVTVRPCKPSCADLMRTPSYYDMLAFGAGLSGFWPHIGTDGLWINSCGCRTDCNCGEICEVSLPPPVGRVDTVRIDGVDLIANLDYRVDGNRLVWVDSTRDCGWPSCQDMTKPDTEVGTFSVTYLNAYPVDTLGAYAAGVLASEFAKACTGGKCRLPSGITSIARQGIAMDFATGAFPNNLTGIREVDAYIGLWNPTPIRQGATVWSPDVKSPRVVR